VVARAFVETVGDPVALRITADRPALRGDGVDAQPLTIEAVDAHGRPSPTANVSVELSLEGPGAMLGHGNGDPNSHEPEKGPHRNLFNGLAQAIVQSTVANHGKLVVRARSEGLRLAEIEIAVEETLTPPRVPSGQPALFLQRWRLSPPAEDPPDPNQDVAENDMNTWAGILPGDLQSFGGLPYAIYRTQFHPFLSVQKSGGVIVFKSVTGLAEVWLDKKLVAKKESFEGQPIEVSLPPHFGDRTLSVLIKSPPGEPAGLGGPVVVVAGDRSATTIQAVPESVRTACVRSLGN
jgi:beta-galactosidase